MHDDTPTTPGRDRHAEMAAWAEDAWEVEPLPRAAKPMTFRLVAATLLFSLAAILAGGLVWLGGWPLFFGGV